MLKVVTISIAMALSCLLQRVDGMTRRPTAQDALGMTWRGGAASMCQAETIGAIAPGMRADLVFYDLATPSLCPLNDPAEQLVFAERGRSIRTVMVDGRIVYQDGRFASADADAVLTEARRMRSAQGGRNKGLYRLAEAIERAR